MKNITNEIIQKYKNNFKTKRARRRNWEKSRTIDIIHDNERNVRRNTTEIPKTTRNTDTSEAADRFT